MKWHPVKPGTDSLPPVLDDFGDWTRSVRVLMVVRTPDFEPTVNVGYVEHWSGYDNEIIWRFDGRDSYSVAGINGTVTHWARLPQPPQKGN